MSATITPARFLQRNPLFRWQSIALAMLSLSIGWGIRGNYGHEFGAMIPGALCAVAVCLASGRADWRERVVFFALFGSIGWGFGGSIAYMPPISYTQSGHWPTQLYGWAAVFLIGFLWAAMGGAGTAYAAVETRERLTATIRPLIWVLAAWAIEYAFEDRMVSWFVRGYDSSGLRHDSPLYWLDSEWMEANWALLGLCLFELWDRRWRGFRHLLRFGAWGAVLGWLLQQALAAVNLLAPLAALLVRYQGDPAATDPNTGRAFGTAHFITNWPGVFFDWSDHLGWILGLTLGLAVFFFRHGRWRSGSSLLMHITLGSYAGFLLGPVLLSYVSMGIGGFRLAPPRGDSWANILGAFAGLLVYLFRNRLAPVACVSILSGIVGGLGLMLAQFAKILLLVPGNPVLSADPVWIRRWAHWHSANWHNLAVEQGAGLFYGLAILVSMGALSNRWKPRGPERRVRRWSEGFGVFFILAVLLYVNLVKNVEDWTRAAVPAAMKAPLFPGIELSALVWFNLTFLLMAVCLAGILRAHYHKPLAIVPSTWLGRGQLLFLIFLWAVLVGNWEKALPGFTEQRLATEWVMIVNGLIVTYLILTLVKEEDAIPLPARLPYSALVRRVSFWGAAALIAGACAFTLVHQWTYGGKWDGYGRPNLRFGPHADWREKPLQTGRAHP